MPSLLPASGSAHLTLLSLLFLPHIRPLQWSDEEKRKRALTPQAKVHPTVFYPAGAVWVQSAWVAQGQTGSKRDAERGEAVMPPLPPGADLSLRLVVCCS